jgi:hypothetical protein
MKQTPGLGRDLLELYKLVSNQQEMLITLLFQRWGNAGGIRLAA